MKLHADRPEQHSISAYGPGWIAVNGERMHASFVLSSEAGILSQWVPVPLPSMQATHFEQLLELAGEPRPELVILGTGEQLRFVHPKHTAVLTSQRVGLETMDTQAACRTFNVLAGEGRHVLAILLQEEV
ncbi:MTH938/NDUFAF3 family protein [Hydrogenophaga sp. 5NK40-0174]|uniref:Mth938-like domain-containing protein n=1 Tax=Hydrogenophaga sp. 5NK40-0174 TaxID=3127649 RepID=UPI00310543B8